MKKIIYLLSILALFATCKKKDATPTNNNSTPAVTVGKNEYTFSSGSCWKAGKTVTLSPYSANYSLNQNYTSVVQAGFVGINFPNKKTGTYFNSDSVTSIQINTGIDSTSCLYDPAIKNLTGTLLEDSISVTVTRYDSPGGLIEGTWSGRMKSLFTSAKVMMSGKFSIIRGADQ